MAGESILIISQYFPPETGASQTRWDELSKRWTDEVSVSVITSAPDYPEGNIYDGYENEWLRHETRNDVDVYYTKTITSSSGNLPRRSVKFIWFMITSMIVGLIYTSPTIVIATSPQPLTGVSAWIIARIKGATFVFEVRDLWPESVLAVSDFNNTTLIWTLERTVAFLYRRSDRLVVVSEAFIDPIVDAGADRSKISYHPNGINLDFYIEDNEQSPVVDEITDEFTISYVGTIGRAHGLSVILEAAQSVNGVQFLIVGDGAEREELESKTKNVPNVIFTGRRPKEEIPSILNQSDVSLVHLKPRDIFETVIPSKLLESMAAGLPIILGVKGEAERILIESDAGVVIEPGDSAQLANAIMFLRTNQDIRERYSTSGRAYVDEHFNWDTIANDYLNTIRCSREINSL